MAGSNGANPFPDIDKKLAAPKKMSEMERNRRAAEEKQKREEALHAETLREFQESFGVFDESLPQDDDYRSYPPSGPRGAGFGRSGYGNMPPGPRRSGPGTLDDFEPPPISIEERKRRRAMEEDEAAMKAEMEGFEEDLAERQIHAAKKKVDHTTAPRNSVRLANLPPSITESQIEKLLKGHLKLHSIDITEQPNPLNIGRRIKTAVVVLESGITATEIERAVSALKDKYLGSGCFLSLSRYLQSDALHPGMPDDSYVPPEHPFGALPQRLETPAIGTLSRAPPPSEFASSGSYDIGSNADDTNQAPTEATVQVCVPNDAQLIRLIHYIAGFYFACEDPNEALEIENQLMALPQVQHDPRFAFLYDSSSEAGTYFRWLLWNPEGLDTLRSSGRIDESAIRLFDDVPIDWVPPVIHMPYPNVSDIAEVMDHPDYDDDEEADDDMPGYRDEHAIPGDEKMLGALRKARLANMLARLPLSRALLDESHTHPIQNFAMTHANRGAFEVVDMLQLNINRPFNASGFDVAIPTPEESEDEGSDAEYEAGDKSNGAGAEGSDWASHGPPAALVEQTDQDTQSHITAQSYKPAQGQPAPPDLIADAKIVALDVITAVCVASYHAATPGSHRYRKLLPEAFFQANAIKTLAETPQEFNWGIIKRDRWISRVMSIFKTWEDLNAFTNEEINGFRRIFDETVNKQKREQEEADEREAKRKDAEVVQPVFKPADKNVSNEEQTAAQDLTYEEDEEDDDDEQYNEEVDGAEIDLDRLSAINLSDGTVKWRLRGVDGQDELIFVPALDEPTPNDERRKGNRPEDRPHLETEQPTPTEQPALTDQPAAPQSEPKKDIDMFAEDSD